MQEKVGVCANCGVDIWCRGGFLQGAVREDGRLVCLRCEADDERNGRSSSLPLSPEVSPHQSSSRNE